MARKWLSGALAFAMIFGCSAPVALADETPVEVVEETALEAVEQEAVEDVEQYAINAPEFGVSSVNIEKADNKTATIGLNNVGDTPKAYYIAISSKENMADAKLVASNGTVAGAPQGQSAYFTGSINSAYDTFTLKLEHSENVGGKYYIQGKFVFDDGKTTETLTTNVVTVNVKATTVVENQINGADASDWTTKKLPVNVGTSTTITFERTEDGDAVEPYSVEVLTTENLSEYVTYSKKVSDKKVVYTITGVKKTATDVSPVPGMKFLVKWSESDTAKEYEAQFEVKGDASEVTKLEVTLGRSTINVGETTSVVAQAYMTNDYGQTVAYDNANIFWKVNGTEMTFKDNKATLENATGDALLTLTKDASLSGKVDIDAKVAGTYTIEATDEAGTITSSAKLTVKSTAGITDITAEKASTTITTPGSSVDLDDLGYKVTVDGKKYDLADLGIELTYEMDKNPMYGKGEDYKSSSVASKNLFTIESGILTIKNAEDAYMAKALEEVPDGKYLRIKIVATAKYNNAEATVDLYVHVTKAQDEAVKMTVTTAKDNEIVSSKKDDGTYNKPYYNYTMMANHAETFTAKVVDTNGFADDIDQAIIWTLEKANNADDIDVADYATIDQVTGTVTPLTVSAGKIQVIATSAANPNLQVSIGLYITADTDPKPTEEPTQAPTVAPTVVPPLLPPRSPLSALALSST